jgi:biopolymer transport protein ExbB
VNLVETGKRIMVGTGAQAVLWLLIALSVISVAMILERAVAFIRRRGNVDALRASLTKALADGDLERAREAMARSPHPAAKVALRGLSLSRGALPRARQAQEAMEAEMIAQKSILESGLGLLATLGNNAPFVGLFGTVVGIVGAFDALGHGATASLGGGAAAASGATAVMSALGEALVATAVGIGVAIPAVAAFNYFSRKTKSTMAGAEMLSKEILAHIESHDGSVVIDTDESWGLPAPTKSGFVSAGSTTSSAPVKSAAQHGGGALLPRTHGV